VSLTHPTTWRVGSINFSINAFVFTAYLRSVGLETKDNYLQGYGRKKVKNHCSKTNVLSKLNV